MAGIPVPRWMLLPQCPYKGKGMAVWGNMAPILRICYQKHS